MAKPCDACQQQIAWRRLTSGWAKYEPILDASGAVIEEYQQNGQSNGQQRFAWRNKASGTKHVCHVTTPERSDTPHRTREEIRREYETRNDTRTPAPEPTPAPAPRYEPTPAPHPDTTPAPDPEALAASVRAIMKAILDEYGIEPPPQRIEVRTRDGWQQSPDGEIYHPKVSELLALLTAEKEAGRFVNVFMYGPAGSSKSHAAIQVAALLGLPHYIVTMPGISAAKLLGGVRADGETTRTPFVEAFENGGVVILDEFDRTEPGTAAMLNSALANGEYTHGGKVIKRHPLCFVLANGNTAMRGATREYTSAKPLDYATAARFRFICWPYDDRTEDALCARLLPANIARKVTAWTRKVRAILKRDHIELVFAGPRESMMICRELAAGHPMESAAHGWVWRGLDDAVVSRIVRECPYPDVQSEA